MRLQTSRSGAARSSWAGDALYNDEEEEEEEEWYEEEDEQRALSGVSVLALVCDALRCTAAQTRAFELLDYRCCALRRLDAEFTGLLVSLAKHNLLDTPFMARCFIFDGVDTEACMARTTLLHTALDARSLELVALLLRAGANPNCVVPGVAVSYSPLARAGMFLCALALYGAGAAVDAAGWSNGGGGNQTVGGDTDPPLYTALLSTDEGLLLVSMG